MKTKKIIAVLLAVFLFAAILAACQGDTGTQTPGDTPVAPPETDETEAAPESSYWDGLGAKDFEGYTFTILDDNENLDQWANIPAEEYTGEAINDAMITRNRFLEDRFNITFNYIEGSTNTATLRRSVQAGDDEFDMVIGRTMGSELGAAASSGILQNMAGLPYLSLEAPWWSRLMYQNTRFEDTMFFTMGDIVPSIYTGYTAMFVNQQMYQDHGFEYNLYQMVFDGTWTLDVLERVTRDMYRDLNADSRMHAHHDQFGVIIEQNNLAANKLAVSTGINLSTIRDGAITVDFSSQFAIDRISRLTDTYRINTAVYPVDLGEFHDLINVTFAEGRSLFLVHFMESAMINLRGMETDFGILPLPKFDEYQESYISFINPWSCSFVAIPLTADAERAAFIMEAKAYASYTMVRPQIYNVVLHHRAARDEESARIIDMIIESSYLDLNSIYNWGGSSDALYGALFSGRSIVSEFERIEARIERDIERYIDALAEH
jgi:hypothetical protein